MRKPNTAMLEMGLRDFNGDRSQAWMVGDRMTDVEAGHRAGFRSVFIEGTEDPSISSFHPPEAVARNFIEVCDWIIDHS